MLTFNIVLGYQGLLFRDFLWFFFRFFFQSDRPTQYQETHWTVNKEKKGDGLRYIFFSLLASFPFFLLLALSLCFTRLCGSHISSNKWLNWFTSHQLHYYIACIIGVLWANRGKCSILCKAQNERKVQDEENIVVPVISICSGSFTHLCPQILTDAGDVKRTSENTFHYSKIVTILATRNTDSGINHRK